MAQLRAGQFYGGVRKRWTLPEGILTRLEHKSGRVVPQHTHERAYLNLVLAGAYREQTRLRKIEYRPWTLVTHPAEFEHRDEIGQKGAQFFLVELRGEWLEGRAAQFAQEGEESVWAAARLWRDLETDDWGAEAGLAELIGTLRGTRRVVERAAPSWLVRVEERLRADFEGAPSLAELAEEAGVHPVHLSRTYRRFRGEGIGDFLRRWRVAEAARRMMEPEARLVEVAAELGFADQSHLARAFKRVTGMTAGELRAADLRTGAGRLKRPASETPELLGQAGGLSHQRA